MRHSETPWRLRLAAFLAALAPVFAVAAPAPPRPNILFCITDDQSAADTGAYGSKSVATPNFDRIAREGVRFEHAFCAAPSCTPSRSALLTGRPIWQLGTGGVLLSDLPSAFPVFTRLLEDEGGFFVGHTGKTWGPGRLDEGWGGRHPVGRAFQARKLPADARRPGVAPTDYAANFRDFLEARLPDRPFFFWFGASEPHLPYAEGAWREGGKSLEDARLHAAWPDGPVVRGDVLDGALEIEHVDRHLGAMLAMLEECGELDRTLVVCTSDHGIPLARAKCNLYDEGTRVPLAVRWPARIPGGRVVTDFTSLIDLAPTFLESAGLPVPEATVGRSLWNVLASPHDGRVDHSRDRVVTALERHTWCRPGGVGYPMRALRTDQFLYIRNFQPDRWPAGDPDYAAFPQGACGDVDRAPSKRFILEGRDAPPDSPLRRSWELCFGKRPAEELYDVRADPDQIRNLAADPALADVKAQLGAQLEHYLRRTEDPRIAGESPWDRFPYHGKIPEGESSADAPK